MRRIAARASLFTVVKMDEIGYHRNIRLYEPVDIRSLFVPRKELERLVISIKKTNRSERRLSSYLNRFSIYELTISRADSLEACLIFAAPKRPIDSERETRERRALIEDRGMAERPSDPRLEANLATP